MKKGTLNFLGRKNHSLFDTNVQIKEMDNVELVLNSANIPESGTAKVRSRPTVRHFASSTDVVHGFNVPTPKVPVMPPFPGPKAIGEVNGDRLSNGLAKSVPDFVEGGILIPPPPSTAPPPPPSIFSTPPPDYPGHLKITDLQAPKPPSMPPPKPPSEEEVLSFLKPPSMAPPKPPSTASNASTSSVPISLPAHVPDIKEFPKFAPPQPPTDRQQMLPHKTLKTPPPKPVRLSSMPSMENLTMGTAPGPPNQPATPSSFNPHNTAKLYTVPKTSILSGQISSENRPKQVLLLQDSGSGDSVPVSVQVDGKDASVVPPAKPHRRNSSGIQLESNLKVMKESLHANLPNQPKQTQIKEPKLETESLGKQQETNQSALTPKFSPELKNRPTQPPSLESSQIKLDRSPAQGRKFSPLLDRKLRNLKGGEGSGARDGPGTSPLALLKAAKERERQRSSLSRQNSTKKEEHPTASIHPSESSPNSFTVIPRPSSSSSLPSQDKPQDRQKPVVLIEPTVNFQSKQKSESPQLVREILLPANAVTNTLPNSSSSPVINVALEKKGMERLSASDNVRDEENGEELCMSLLPPPPEFANFDELDGNVESPPSFPPPDPPMKKALPPTASPVLTPSLPHNSVQAPSPPPKPSSPPKQPPSPPKLPPPSTDFKPLLMTQTKPKVPPTQAPTPLSASQATLLSILQKKMLEMDHKMVPTKEAEASSQDWNAPPSENENKVPASSRTRPTSYSIPPKTGGLDMRELENRVAKQSQDMSSSKVAPCNGPQAKQPHGMTFTVRPGTKQPITLVSKGDTS
ncbi:uncharacterized protein FYW47_000494 [Aplochiton taeniatus]